MSVPTVILPVLDEYLELMEQRLPDLINAFYIHGSIALGAFNPACSDIDFVAMLNRHCTIDDMNSLREVHYLLRKKYPKWKMDGCYLQWDDWGKSAEEISPHPYMNDVFHPVSQEGAGWVTWWLLKHCGEAIVGIDPKTLDFVVDWDIFSVDIHNNLNSYWIRFIRDPRRMAWLFSDYGVQWSILGILRQFYTLREHEIISKLAAGEYGLSYLPERWHRIIQEAIFLQEQKPSSLYRSRIHRFLDARQFLQNLIHLCNLHAATDTISAGF